MIKWAARFSRRHDTHLHQQLGPVLSVEGQPPNLAIASDRLQPQNTFGVARPPEKQRSQTMNSFAAAPPGQSPCGGLGGFAAGVPLVPAEPLPPEYQIVGLGGGWHLPQTSSTGSGAERVPPASSTMLIGKTVTGHQVRAFAGDWTTLAGTATAMRHRVVAPLPSFICERRY